MDQEAVVVVVALTVHVHMAVVRAALGGDRAVVENTVKDAVAVACLLPLACVAFHNLQTAA